MENYKLEKIENLSQEEFDQLPFGIIIVDHDGIVLRYNEYESRKSSMDPAFVIGKSFFDEIAPCTKVQEFHGKFDKGVKERNLFATFSFIFKFKKESKVVTITMTYNPETKNVIIRVDWIG